MHRYVKYVKYVTICCAIEKQMQWMCHPWRVQMLPRTCLCNSKVSVFILPIWLGRENLSIIFFQIAAWCKICSHLSLNLVTNSLFCCCADWRLASMETAQTFWEQSSKGLVASALSYSRHPMFIDLFEKLFVKTVNFVLFARNCRQPNCCEIVVLSRPWISELYKLVLSYSPGEKLVQNWHLCGSTWQLQSWMQNSGMGLLLICWWRSESLSPPMEVSSLPPGQ